MTTTINEIRDLQAKRKVKANEPEPEVKVRYAVSVEHLTHLENAQHGAKSVISVAIKITLVLNVGSKQSGGGDRKSCSTSRGCKGKG